MLGFLPSAPPTGSEAGQGCGAAGAVGWEEAVSVGVGSPHSLCLHTWPNEESEQTGFHTGLTWAHSVPGAQLPPAHADPDACPGFSRGKSRSLGMEPGQLWSGKLDSQTVSLPMLTISTTGSG